MEKGVSQAETYAPSDIRGRPRDPELENRVFDAAISIYASGGWAAFTFASIAKAAAVGKAALYRRWGSRGDLLQAVLAARWFPLRDIDTGSLREDLLMVAGLWFDLLTGPHGGVLLHLQADIRSHVDARASAGRYGAGLLRQGRDVGRRAIARGEIPPGFDAALIKDAVVGGVVNRINSTNRRAWAAMLKQRDAFLADLVDLVLGSLASAAREAP
jgi:AcrR family transcriptional regulator